MTVYIYRRQPSDGAVELARALALEGIPAHKVRELTPRRIARASAVICWGDVAPPGVRRSLNNVEPISKLREIQVMQAAGVPTVVYATSIGEIAMADRGNWVGRSTSHVGGSDLLDPPVRPAFWVRRENIVKEFRLHIFRDQSIRAGRKEKYRDDAHGWIRSYNAGWRLVYDGHGVSDKHRAAGKAAVAALGLDFGAVDIGERDDGNVVVFEVNRAPGIEGNTVSTYVRYIKEWLDNER